MTADVEPRTWRIALTYDKIPLSLNDRMPWQWRARIVRTLRDRVRAMTRHLEIPRLEAVHVDMFWTPKINRTRDADNLVATLKPGIDGLRDYPARYRRVEGREVLIDPAWTGIVADDDPAHVTWSRPLFKPADKSVTERLEFIITERQGGE